METKKGLESRQLSVGMTGDDISNLHQVINAIGIEVNEAEIRNKQFGETTKEAIRRLQLLAGMEPSGEVTPQMSEFLINALARLQAPQPIKDIVEQGHLGEYYLEGDITDIDGLPLAGVTVIAEKRDLRETHEIGYAKTDQLGHYRIVCTTGENDPQIRINKGGKEESDIRLRVVSSKGITLHNSEPYFHVLSGANITIALGGAARREPCEFLKIGVNLKPSLGELRPEELVENKDFQDVTFLANRTGLGKTQIAFYSIAVRIAETTGLSPEFFYALFTQKIPLNAPVVAQASTSSGIDFNYNAQRLLNSVLSTSDEVIAKAIEIAISQNIIPASYTEKVKNDLASLAPLRTNTLLSATWGMGKTPIHAVLDAAAVPVEKQRKFITLFSNRGAAKRDIWKELENNPEFTQEEVAKLHFSFNIGLYTKGHMPLIRKIMEMQKQGQISESADLARLNVGDWKALINSRYQGETIGIPANFTASNDQEAVDTFASLLERNFERAYPTTAFSARLVEDKNSPFKEKEPLVHFLDSNPSFNLLSTNVDRYLKDNPPVLSDTELDNLRKGLNTSKRLIKLASSYAAIKPLLTDGVHSSQQIYAMGRSQFVHKYEDNPAIGAAEAMNIYAKAEYTYALALDLTMNNNAIVLGGNPNSIGNYDPKQLIQEIKGFPNLETLFGPLDFLECDSSRTVLSPAAYLVDLLNFLSWRSTNLSRLPESEEKPQLSVKDILLYRRPDLVHIKLNAANTNTILPYIDLINELLEEAVAPPDNPAFAGAPTAVQRQTTLTTDELNANPQYVNQYAYQKLADAKAVFPWTLPFDLPLIEARKYLEQLGVDRVKLMRTFQKPASIPSQPITNMAIEGLGLTPAEANIITGGSGNQPWECWGLAENNNYIMDPVVTTITFSGSWIQVLSNVRILLARSGLTFKTLLQLLGTTFINPEAAIQVRYQTSGPDDIPDQSNLDTMTVVGFDQDPEALERLHRFVRLMRKLNWDVHTLDSAITRLQANTPGGLSKLNLTLLRQLYIVKTAMKRFKVSADTATTFFSLLETHDFMDFPNRGDVRHSLYRDLFQNRAVLNPVDPAFELNETGADVKETNALIANHKPALLGAFQVFDPDLSLAIDALTDGKLTLANLSTLYRHIVLSKGLGVSITELISLKALFETEQAKAPFDPFDPSRPELLSIFCDIVDRIRSTKFSIPELDYLLRHNFTSTSGFKPDEIIVGTLLKSILDGLSKVKAGNTASDDRRLLAKGFIAQQLANALGLPVATTAMLLEKWAISSNGKDIPMIEEFLILLDVVRDPNANTTPISLNPRESGINTADSNNPIPFDPYFTWFVALDKAARIINGFGFTEEETAWLCERGVNQGWLDLTKLPVKAQNSSNGRFIRWIRLADASLVKKSLPSDGTPFTSLFDLDPEGLFASADLPGDRGQPKRQKGRRLSKKRYISRLAERTGWLIQDLEFLCGSSSQPTLATNENQPQNSIRAPLVPGRETRTKLRKSSENPGLLGLTYPDDYCSERALARLIPAFAMLRKLGNSADIGGWIGASVTAEQAIAIKQSVKAKYSDDLWVKVAKQLRDPLREQQRDALVDYLLVNPPDSVDPALTRWYDASDVYSHFLIDVEMGASQSTSRIVQAIAAIQLFVLRCLLNLEREVAVNVKIDQKWEQWKWMSRYRLWEANRKVFLYPENWIEPSLRKDKSPFMADLENDLLQKEVTQETSEDALRSYLEKLDAVARLEVVGMYDDLPGLPVEPPKDISIEISPKQIVLDQGGTCQFTARVTGPNNKMVTWSSSPGQIDSTNGGFSAPGWPCICTVTATSLADKSKSATALVTVPTISVNIDPREAKLVIGESQQFTAVVSGTTSKEVDWISTEGTIDASGLFHIEKVRNSSVTATSIADRTKSAKATVTVFPCHPPYGLSARLETCPEPLRLIHAFWMDKNLNTGAYILEFKLNTQSKFQQIPPILAHVPSTDGANVAFYVETSISGATSCSFRVQSFIFTAGFSDYSDVYTILLQVP